MRLLVLEWVSPHQHNGRTYGHRYSIVQHSSRKRILFALITGSDDITTVANSTGSTSETSESQTQLAVREVCVRRHCEDVLYGWWDSQRDPWLPGATGTAQMASTTTKYVIPTGFQVGNKSIHVWFLPSRHVCHHSLTVSTEM